jgi:MFS family permease
MVGAAIMIVVPELSFVSEWAFFTAVMVQLALIGIGWNFAYVGATTGVAAAYTPAEKFKAQSLNDTIVFSFGAACTLAAGPLLHRFGELPLALGALALYVIALIWNVPMLLAHQAQRKADAEKAINDAAPR